MLRAGRICTTRLSRSNSIFVPLSSLPSVCTHSVNLCRNFSASAVFLQAEILDGKKLAAEIRRRAAAEVAEIQQKHVNFSPKLVIIQLGSRDDSSAYVRMKLRAAREARVDCQHVKLDSDTSEAELLNRIEALNDDPSVHGILVQLPLPDHISEPLITNAVAPEKDVDGFSRYNAGELAKRGGTPLFLPCTPHGVLRLLEAAEVPLRGKRAVVLGRSDIVGTPVAQLLRNADATVTVCHSRTENIAEIVKTADIVVAALGKPRFVTAEMIKPGAAVVDVGINYEEDGTARNGRRLVGDVDAGCAEVAGKLTPVPGGVGPMTVAMLVQNVVDAARRAQETSAHRHITPLGLKVQHPTPSDADISRAQQPKKISQLAAELGVTDSELELFGKYKAKVSPSVAQRLSHRKDGYYVLVAGITPTPLGEGKSTTTLGLVQALTARLGRLSIATVRQPSMGPTFGVKGGAAGGGYAQVLPMDEFNLHLTGDIHAVSAATNLLAAAVDTRMFHEATQKDTALYSRLTPRKNGKRVFAPHMLTRLAKLGINKTNPEDLTSEEIRKFARLDINPETVTWRRVVDCNDRHLRGITIGEAPTEKGLVRHTGFDISVASEVMAILALSTSLKDLRQRVGKIVVGSSKSGDPVTAEDLGAAGAVAALMRDAVKPNLMQTLEGTPVFVHAGPFANISIGASSVIADRVALKLAGSEPGEPNGKRGFVVTEAGFDFTMGGERFFNIKSRVSGASPNVVVIVATVRALKLHGGAPDVKPGAPLAAEYETENVELVRKGCANLQKQIENARSFGAPVVVAINRFATDTSAEHEVIAEEAKAAGAVAAIPTNHYAEGGAGAEELAKVVAEVAEMGENSEEVSKQVQFTYNLTDSVEDKLRAIVRKMYNGADIELSDLAREKINLYTEQGFGGLPVCIAKTQYSLSHDPKLKGVPSGFTVPIRDVRASVGAGYLYALAAEITTIPGLPTRPGFMDVDIDEEGEIVGLF